MLPVYSVDGERVDSLDLKALLLTRGIRVQPEVYRMFGSTHRFSPDPMQCNALFLPDGTVVHIADVGAAAPFELALGAEGAPRLRHRGNFVADVSFPPATSFYRQRTSRGVPFLGMPHGLPPVESTVTPDLEFFRTVKRGLAEIYHKHQCEPPGGDGYNVCLCRDTWKHRVDLAAAG
jgi:hypothetical protein